MGACQDFNCLVAFRGFLNCVTPSWALHSRGELCMSVIIHFWLREAFNNLSTESVGKENTNGDPKKLTQAPKVLGFLIPKVAK